MISLTYQNKKNATDNKTFAEIGYSSLSKDNLINFLDKITVNYKKYPTSNQIYPAIFSPFFGSKTMNRNFIYNKKIFLKNVRTSKTTNKKYTLDFLADEIIKNNYYWETNIDNRTTYSYKIKYQSTKLSNSNYNYNHNTECCVGDSEGTFYDI